MTDTSPTPPPTSDKPTSPMPLARRLGWHAHANCRGTGADVFHPTVGTGYMESPAYLLCAACPVRRPCLAQAIADNEKHAIWGGRSPRGIARLRRDLSHARTEAVQNLIIDAAVNREIKGGTTPTPVPIRTVKVGDTLSDGRHSIYHVLGYERTDTRVTLYLQRRNHRRKWVSATLPTTIHAAVLAIDPT